MKALITALGLAFWGLPGFAAENIDRHTITGDFNGDGLSNDTAYFRIGPEGAGHVLVIRFEGGDTDHIVKPADALLHTLMNTPGMKLRTAPDGTYQNPCGYGSCLGKPEGLLAASDSIVLYKDGTFETFVFWHTDQFLLHPQRQISGDFNGDGLSNDEAYFAMESGGESYKLVVKFEGDDAEHILSQGDKLAYLQYVGLRVAPQGTYENPCVRGAYESCAGMLQSITTASDSVAIYKEEAFETLFVWNSDADQFLVHPVSD